MTPRDDASEPAPKSKLRTLSRIVATTPGCVPLRLAYEASAARRPKSWSDIEEIFLRGMEGFDRNIVSGVADIGDLQNGKGDFFNDMLSLILENCAQVQLYSRGDVPGLIFPKHKLDVTYPSTGPIEFVLEAKAVGTPKHSLSPKEKPIGRAGSADLDKRVKEIAFKAIDLKAEYARILATQGESPSVMAGDLTTWLRSVKPRSYVFFAARVINEKDRERVLHFATIAQLVSDSVGVYCFGPESADRPTDYATKKVPAHLELDRVLFRACQDLTAIKRAPRIQT